MPTWRLVHPSTTQRWQVHRKLVVDHTVESHIAGSDASLEAYAEGEEIPEDPQYLWLGGHINTTTDETIRNLWVANGFDAVEDTTGYPGADVYPALDLYPLAG
jgi:hypothetical protein